MPRNVSILCAIFLSFLCSTTLGDSAFSNFGPNDEFGSKRVGVGDFPDNPTPNFHLGFKFTAEATGNVESLDAAVWEYLPGKNDSMRFSIWSDFNGLPGEQIWDATVAPGVSPQVQNVHSADSGNPLIEAGESYWVSARSNNGTGGYFWQIGFSGAESESAFDPSGGEGWQGPVFSDQASIRVNIAPVKGAVGDVNCDGSINLLDVEPFIDALISGTFQEKADINTDGAVDLLDVEPFVILLTGD